MQYVWTIASVKLKNFIRNANLIKASWNGVFVELQTRLLQFQIDAAKERDLKEESDREKCRMEFE